MADEVKQPAVAVRLQQPVRPRAQRWTAYSAEPAAAGDFVVYGDHLDAVRAAEAAARTKALQDAARWVDDELGRAVQDGSGLEAVQALMAARDMLMAHAELMATTVSVPGA